jgi:hypothetical protein
VKRDHIPVMYTKGALYQARSDAAQLTRIREHRALKQHPSHAPKDVSIQTILVALLIMRGTGTGSY